MMEGIVSFKDWQKLDLRVGKILDVEDVKGADKLYKLTIDLGTEKRILVAGLKPYYTQGRLKDKIVIVFCNLEPRKIRGIESRGMVLAAVIYDKNGKEKECKLLETDDEIELGSQIT